MAEMGNENIDLLDLDDAAELPELPCDDPFQPARPRRPWLLFGAAAVVIALSAYIIVRVIGKDSSESAEISLETPTVITVENDEQAKEAKPVEQPKAENPKPIEAGRVVEDRKEVKFNPDAEHHKVTQSKAQSPKPVVKTSAGSWFAQLGSYTSRSSAEKAQKRMWTAHASLLADKQLVILAAVLPDGKTTYRLRVPGFTNSAAANAFCNNAKSDGLPDCYATK
jgi:hypothetical protein